MSRQYLSQDAKTKPCPRCNVGQIYSDWRSSNNPTIDGKQVCTKCKSDDLISQFLNNRKD